MIDSELEKTIIKHGMQLSRIETLMIGIQKFLDKADSQKEKDNEFRLECQRDNSKRFVGVKIFYSVSAVVASAIGYLFTK